MQARVKPSGREKQEQTYQNQPLPQPLQAEAKAEASKPQGGNQPEAAQPPQPPLGNVKISTKQAKARRRRERRRITLCTA